MNKSLLLGFVAIVILLTVYFLGRWRKSKKKLIIFNQESTTVPSRSLQLKYGPVQLVHKFCPQEDATSIFGIEEKDSFDERLDELTRKLAEKEGRLKISRSKLRETKYEIDNLPIVNEDVRVKYRSILTSLKSDLKMNERECKKLQEQIEWVSKKRAELRSNVKIGKHGCWSDCPGASHES